MRTTLAAIAVLVALMMVPIALTAQDHDDLDLREANVVNVSVEAQDGSYRFDVTLIHDDDGEDGYADRWQVETLNGTELGRRELAHPHGTREFTRSTTVEIPDNTTLVVVRGHDQTHGFGGQAMVVNLTSGETEAVQQGPEPTNFTDYEFGTATNATTTES
jgi:hypothetical protein